MPNSKNLKGGFVHFDSNAQVDQVVAFQFNPETIERTAIPVDSGRQSQEMIRFTLEFDATDALERGDPTTANLGIHPALAALEMFLQASTADSSSQDRLKPFTLFVWGIERVIPVRFVQLEIHETMFDSHLNPLRATVAVSLETLTDADLKENPRAQSFMDSYVSQKGSLANKPGSSGSTEELLTAIKTRPPG